MKPGLVFVYNADSGVFNALADLAHKALSPETYSCNLCALTYSALGMRREWKRFMDKLGRPVEFLHRDELRERLGLEVVPLPAIFRRGPEGGLEVWLDAATLNGCSSMESLQDAIRSRVAEEADVEGGSPRESDPPQP